MFAEDLAVKKHRAIRGIVAAQLAFRAMLRDYFWRNQPLPSIARLFHILSPFHAGTSIANTIARVHVWR